MMRPIWTSTILAASLAALTAPAPAQQPPIQAPPTRSQPQSPRIRAPIRDNERTFQKGVKSWREISREHIVMQQRDYSCGAAALATLMRYHLNENVTELQLLLEVVQMLTPEEMRDRVQNGLSLTDLRRVAVRTGHLATIGTLEFDKLRESKVPLVVGIVVNEFDHFVVFRGVDDQYVYLADPARGHVRTPIEEFKKQWQKNAVLVVVRMDDAGEDKRSPYMVTPEESSLGQTNRNFVRGQVTTKFLPYP
ncbi:MAG TPA: C39 family peptidase [Pirellulaceae bacterium]|nr:C39 family peptidase [Pirellulaceae bacterium]